MWALGAEAVLAAVCLVGDDDDVAAVGEHRVFGFAGLGRELLDGGEHDAAGGTGQCFLQILPAFGLPGGMADKIAAHRERSEQLVIEIVSVGDYHNGRVLHHRVGDDLSGVERHEQALSGALCVPDYADAPVTLRLRFN